MVELFANSGDPDQMSHSAVSDLGFALFAKNPFRGCHILQCLIWGLHCLPRTLLGVSRLQWVKRLVEIVADIFFFYLHTLYI